MSNVIDFEAARRARAERRALEAHGTDHFVAAVRLVAAMVLLGIATMVGGTNSSTTR